MLRIESGTERRSPVERPSVTSAGERWLGVQASRRYLEALVASGGDLTLHPQVRASLRERGLVEARHPGVAAADLQRLAHALTVLVDAESSSLLASILPAHIAKVLLSLDFRLDHVGREVVCPVDPLLEAWHGAIEAVGFSPVPQTGRWATDRGDLVFPSVQVVEAIRGDDPDVGAVTIARSFLEGSTLSEPVSIELFHVGEREGTSVQAVRHMNRRLAALEHDPFRVQPASPPICHLSVEVADRQALDVVHELAGRDDSDLVRLYAPEISVNPADGSHNTKLAVRRVRLPSAPTNVLEFVYFE